MVNHRGTRFGGESPKTPARPVVLESERDIATHTSEGGCGNIWVVDLGSSLVFAGFAMGRIDENPTKTDESG